jgi:hypothetical protein
MVDRRGGGETDTPHINSVRTEFTARERNDLGMTRSGRTGAWSTDAGGGEIDTPHINSVRTEFAAPASYPNSSNSGRYRATPDTPRISPSSRITAMNAASGTPSH